MNHDVLECTSDVEMIDDAPIHYQQQPHTIELTDSEGNEEDYPKYNPDNDAKMKELEKRLQSELNLRVGHIGYGYGEDEDDDMVDEEESKLHSTKKKTAIKKKTTKTEGKNSDGKLK